MRVLIHLTEDAPFVPLRERIEVTKLSHDLWQVQARFGFMQRNAARATDYYDIPPEHTVELGMRIVI